MLFKRSIQVTILLCTLAQNWCQNTTNLPAPDNSTIEIIPSDVPNITHVTNYDYLVELKFDVQEKKVPEIIVNATYTHSLNNSVTVSNIAQLYGLSNISQSSTSAALAALNIKPSIYSLDAALEELQIIFKDFYDQIFSDRLNISGVTLRNFIIALGIDEREFTSAMSFNDPDPFEEFKKGNFSKESLEGALNGTDKTLEELFAACRDVLLSKALTLETDDLVRILIKYNFTQNEAVQLWQYLNITTEDIKAIPSFASILANAVAELNEETYLGVVVGENSVAVNEKVFDVWQSHAISKMYAQAIDRSTMIEIEGKQSPSDFDHIVALRSNKTYNNNSIAQWAAASGDIRNCSFVTLQNGTVVSEYVDEAKYVSPYFEITANFSRADLVVGSPLVCQGIVYGLALEELDSGYVVFDSFVKKQERSAGLTEVVSRCLIIVGILGCYSIH